ncbi:hypothetical protein HK101_010553 [Irineochytrium annulatum]|nr:hypothetical protein HK101_010553 [Irineochytrium annulatum]
MTEHVLPLCIDLLNPWTHSGRLTLYATLFVSRATFAVATLRLRSTLCRIESHSHIIVRRAALHGERYRESFDDSHLVHVDSRSPSVPVAYGSKEWRWDLYIKSLRHLVIESQAPKGRTRLSPATMMPWLEMVDRIEVRVVQCELGEEDMVVRAEWMEWAKNQVKRPNGPRHLITNADLPYSTVEHFWQEVKPFLMVPTSITTFSLIHCTVSHTPGRKACTLLRQAELFWKAVASTGARYREFTRLDADMNARQISLAFAVDLHERPFEECDNMAKAIGSLNETWPTQLIVRRRYPRYLLKLAMDAFPPSFLTTLVLDFQELNEADLTPLAALPSLASLRLTFNTENRFWKSLGSLSNAALPPVKPFSGSVTTLGRMKGLRSLTLECGQWDGTGLNSALAGLDRLTHLDLTLISKTLSAREPVAVRLRSLARIRLAVTAGVRVVDWETIRDDGWPALEELVAVMSTALVVSGEEDKKGSTVEILRAVLLDVAKTPLLAYVLISTGVKEWRLRSSSAGAKRLKRELIL